MGWYGTNTDWCRCERCGEVFRNDELIVEEGIRGPMYKATEDEYRCPCCGSYDISYDEPDPTKEEEDEEDE